MAFGQFVHFTSFLRRTCNRLLDQDVFACFEGFHGPLVVHIIWELVGFFESRNAND